MKTETKPTDGVCYRWALFVRRIVAVVYKEDMPAHKVAALNRCFAPVRGISRMSYIAPLKTTARAFSGI